jgi:hypothetical protein
MDDRNLLGVIIDGGTTPVEKYRVVIASATEGKATTPAASGDRVLGVTQQRSEDDGAHVSLVTKGRTKCEAASAITYGDRVRASGTVGKIEKAVASLTTALAGANNDLVWTALTPWLGKMGELITIEYKDAPVHGTAENIEVIGTGIIVNLMTNAGTGAIESTGDTIKATLAAHAVASLMVSAVDATGNDGSGVVIVMAPTRLSGGKGDFGTALETAAADTELIDVEVD